MDSLEPLALGPGNSDHFVNSSPFAFTTGSQPAHAFQTGRYQTSFGQYQHQGHVENALLAQQRQINELEQQLHQSQSWILQQQSQLQEPQQHHFIHLNPNQSRAAAGASFGPLEAPANSVAYPHSHGLFQQQQQRELGTYAPFPEEVSAFDQSAFSMQQILNQQQQLSQDQDYQSSIAASTDPEQASFENTGDRVNTTESAPMNEQDQNVFGWNTFSQD